MHLISDLVSDLSIIGKDAYDSTVRELDNRQVEIDSSEITGLAVSFLRNIGNIRMVMDSLEMAVDLGKDVGPIAKAFNSMETESVPSYSVWKLMREMNSPEIKKALGYGVTFMKNVSKDIKIEE